MCGIAGFVDKRPAIDKQKLLAMRDALAHRGPDDAGIQLWPADDRGEAFGKWRVGLTHRRLSIIDLSAAGHQPMSNEDGSVWITYNGEFYNYIEYKDQLKSRHRFQSNTDTETILHLYEEYGLQETLKRINGMFAFAIWDNHEKKLLMARDRLGKKPLYYMHQEDGSLVFASEIKAFEAAGLLDRDALDLEALHQFWMYGYVAGSGTVYSSVKKLPPGHCAIWENGNLIVREYWDCPFDPSPRPRALANLVDELEALLCDAIRLRLISDVPVGLFLSGGIDSSLICALTAEVAGTDIRTFTIEFANADFNEAPYAAAVSRQLGLSNTRLPVTDDLRFHFESIVRHFDEPFGDSSAIPTFYVSKLAREHVTVALTGDGGDELFAGYDHYAKGLRLWGNIRQRLLFLSKTHPFETIVDLPLMWLSTANRLPDLEKIVSGKVQRKVLSHRAWSGISKDSAYRLRRQWLSRVKNCDLLSRMQYLHVKGYLPEDILVKVDRMSMAHGLECRCPFLDHRIVEFASRLPYEAKIDRSGRQKRLLRALLQRYVPKNLIDRPKAGFRVPWADWCREDLGDELRQRWLSLTSPYFNADAADILFPQDKLGWTSRQWNAFSTLAFFQ